MVENILRSLFHVVTTANIHGHVEIYCKEYIQFGKFDFVLESQSINRDL